MHCDGGGLCVSTIGRCCWISSASSASVRGGGSASNVDRACSAAVFFRARPGGLGFFFLAKLKPPSTLRRGGTKKEMAPTTTLDRVLVETIVLAHLRRSAPMSRP